LERHNAAGVIVYRRTPEGCRFLLLRSRLTRRPLWEFPKGGVDTGESARDAALRELREETGLRPADIRIVPDFQRTEEYEFISENDGERVRVGKRVTYFLAEAAHADVRLSAHEASEFAWLPLAEAARRIRYPARRRMLEAAARRAGCTPDEQDYSEATSRSRDASVPSGSESA
jgi:8-oxo-dGTP pyrophosphatase MutT (NUDIX family)